MVNENKEITAAVWGLHWSVWRPHNSDRYYIQDETGLPLDKRYTVDRIYRNAILILYWRWDCYSFAAIFPWRSLFFNFKHGLERWSRSNLYPIGSGVHDLEGYRAK